MGHEKRYAQQASLKREPRIRGAARGADHPGRNRLSTSTRYFLGYASFLDGGKLSDKQVI